MSVYNTKYTDVVFGDDFFFLNSMWEVYTITVDILLSVPSDRNIHAEDLTVTTPKVYQIWKQIKRNRHDFFGDIF